MAAYATPQSEPAARTLSLATAPPNHRRVRLVAEPSANDVGFSELAIIDQFVDRLAERVAAMVAARMSAAKPRTDEWLDSRHAAHYLGVHRDTLRKLAAERTIPAEQDGPGCKLYFRRCDLDAWRRSGGRPRHLGSSVDVAA